MASKIITEFDENDKEFIQKAVTQAANNYWNQNKSELNLKISELKENAERIEIRISKTEEELINKLKQEVNQAKDRIHSQLKYWIVSIISLIILIATASTVYSIREETKRVNETAIKMQEATITLYEKLESFNTRVNESNNLLLVEQGKLKEKSKLIDETIKNYNDELENLKKLKAEYQKAIETMKNAH